MGSTTNSGLRLLADLGLPERYEVRRRIASGGMASVWCAHDTVLGRDVAIKLLSEPFASDPAAIRRFKREARAAARLSSHPHVVTIYDVGETPGPKAGSQRTFLVMEYLPGGTVADALRVGAVVRPDVLEWVRQAASALDFAHGKGVLHRDIKPANFLLDGQRTLYVADFGIAHLGTEETLTGTGEMLGTAAYLAPERAVGQPATEASDIYSLAVAAYELLVGERPFTSEHFATQARQHVEEEPPAASGRNPGLPRALDAVLATGLAKQPERRWPSAGAFAEALEHALRPAAARRRAVAATARTRRHPAAAPARPAGSTAARTAGSTARLAGSTARTAGSTARTAGSTAPFIGSHGRSRLGRRLAAVGVALVLLAGAALATGALTGGSRAKHSTQTAALHPATTHRAAPLRPAHPKAGAAARRSPPAAAATTSSTTTAATTTTTPTTTSAPPRSADALQAQGHALMVAGEYPSAIALLRQAVAAAPRNSLIYAYALYDLGRSLRLAGDPRAAVPILWQRMRIPNQTGVVRQELQLALQALGTATTGSKPKQSGGVSPQTPKGHGKPGRHGGRARSAGADSGGAPAFAGANSQGD